MTRKREKFQPIWDPATVTFHDWHAKITFKENTEILLSLIDLWPTGGYACRLLSGCFQLKPCRFLLDATDTCGRSMPVGYIANDGRFNDTGWPKDPH